MNLHDTQEQKKLLSIDNERAIYEDGWWMTRKDYDFANSKFTWGKIVEENRDRIGWNRDEKTKQLTYFFLPV